jgi:hypothetical protein
MRWHWRWMRSLTLFALPCAALLVDWPRTSAQTQPPVVFVISKSIGGEDISLATLRRAYANQGTEYRGVRLIPFNLALGSTARTRVDRVLLGLSPDQVGAFWIDQRVRSGVVPPRTIQSQEMLLRVVASMRGVIGYVELPVQRLPREVQALTIDGQSPQDPEYPGALR